MMGLGIWSLHITGMLAYQFPFPVHHRLGLTLTALIPATLAGGVAQYAMSRPSAPVWQQAMAGCLFSLGIAIVHYVGSLAIDMPATLYLAIPSTILASIAALILGAATFATFHGARQLPTFKGFNIGLIFIGVMMAAVMYGIHYLYMHAAYFLPLIEGVNPELFSDNDALLAAIVAVVSTLLAIGALTSVLVERKQQNSIKNLLDTQHRLEEVLDSMHDGVILLDKRARVVMCNHSFESLTGLCLADLQNRSLLRLSSVLRIDHQRGDILRSLRQNGVWVGDVEVRAIQGHRLPARLSINQVLAGDGDSCGDSTSYLTSYDASSYTASGHSVTGYNTASYYVATLSDTTAHHDAQRRLHYQAHHDALTGLPNRIALCERIQSLQLSSGDSGRHVMLLLVDIDNFKGINGSLGQATGDRLLRALAARLKPWARHASDLARFSSNEFALLYEGLSADVEKAEVQARTKANSVLNALNGDYSLAGERHTCRVSGGFLTFRGSQWSSEELLKYTGLALLDSKSEGTQRPSAFAPDMVERMNSRLLLERQLQDAIQSEQLRLYLQAQVDDSGKLLGAEALVRWEHPEHGLIAPSAFIEVAEDTGQIVELGSWVLRQACHTLAEWQRHPGRRQWQLSVNVSMREFQRQDFIGTIRQTLETSGAPPTCLTLELTESLMLGDNHPVIDVLTQLRAIGVRLSIDDFGTGYSSLSHLKSLPLDVLKIDSTFVRDLDDDPNTAPIVETIITLARTLGLDVIAEGVETPQQRQRLIELGCQRFQGYLFSAPLPVDEFVARFEAGDIARPPPPSSTGTNTLR